MITFHFLGKCLYSAFIYILACILNLLAHHGLDLSPASSKAHYLLYRVLFPYFERLLREYESRFEKKYCYFRPCDP